MQTTRLATVGRLAREDRDPPALVSVFADRHDGRWALWYNDPSELPRMIVRDEVELLERAAYKAEAIAPCPDRLINNVVEPWIDGSSRRHGLSSTNEKTLIDVTRAASRHHRP
jgi:hypothetical protein